MACGCFRGNLQAFSKKVKQTHGDNEHAKQYGLAIQLAAAHIDLTPEVEE